MCFPNFQWMMGHHRFTMSCQARAPTGWVAAVSDPILRGLARYVPYLRWSLVSRVVTVVTVVGSAMAVLAWQVGWWRQKLNEAERSSFVLIPICFIILMVYTEGMCLRQLSVPSFCFSRSLLNHFQHPVKQSAAAKENHERNNIPMWYFRSLAIVTHIYIYILFSHMFTLKASVQLWPCSNGRTKERPEMTTGLSLAEKDVRNGQAQWFSFRLPSWWMKLCVDCHNCI